MLSRHTGLVRLAFAKLGAQSLGKHTSDSGASFAYTRRTDNNRTQGNRDGQAGMNFNKINTNSSIRDKILQGTTGEEVLRTIGDNTHLMNATNSANALRALSRFFPSSPKFGKEMRANTNFQLLMEKVLSGVEQLEIGAVSDFCQAIKRGDQRGFGLGIKGETYTKLSSRITEIIQDKKYDDRALFYLFFNTCELGLANDLIAGELLKIIREAPQQLNTVQIKNTLMTLATKKGPLTGLETLLAIEIEKVLPEYLSGIEPSNKARIFRDLAALEFQYLAPKYRVSQSLNAIKTELKEGLESFNEDDVILILEAFQYLPVTYPNDLLEIFKDVMNNTIQHNPAAVKSSFLLRYIAYAGQLNRARRLNPTSLNSIFNVIANRLKTDPQMQREIEEFAQYLLKINAAHQPLKTEILAYMKSAEAKTGNLKINCFEYVMRNSTPEVAKSIAKEILTAECIEKMHTPSLRRVRAILDGTDEVGFKPIIDQIASHPEYNKIENLRTTIFSGAFRHKQQEVALQIASSLFENLKTSGRTLNSQTFSVLLACIQTSETRAELIARPELQNLTSQQISGLLTALFDLESTNDNQWRFTLDILKANIERFTASKVISYLNNNGTKLNSIALRSPGVIQAWASFIASIPKVEEERITNLFPLLLRLSDSGIINYRLIEKFRNLVERCVKENTPVNFVTLGAATEFLVEHENCSFEIAQYLFDKSKTQKYVDKSRYKTIAYLYGRKQATQEQKDNLLAVASEEIKKLITNLGSLDPKHVLEAASALLIFPYPLIKEHISALQSAIKDHIAYVTPNVYTELVSCLASTNRSRAELELYQPLLKEIASHFSTFASKLRVSELIDVIEAFAFSNYKGSNVYNGALTLVGTLFPRIRIPDLLRLLESFSHVQLKHVELFDRIIERVIEDTSRLERDDIDSLARSLLRVGYQETHKTNPKLIDVVMSRKLLYSQRKLNLDTREPTVPLLYLGLGSAKRGRAPEEILRHCVSSQSCCQESSLHYHCSQSPRLPQSCLSQRDLRPDLRESVARET